MTIDELKIIKQSLEYSKPIPVKVEIFPELTHNRWLNLFSIARIHKLILRDTLSTGIAEAYRAEAIAIADKEILKKEK